MVIIYLGFPEAFDKTVLKRENSPIRQRVAKPPGLGGLLRRRGACSGTSGSGQCGQLWQGPTQ